jgi:hypothetical protein
MRIQHKPQQHRTPYFHHVAPVPDWWHLIPAAVVGREQVCVHRPHGNSLAGGTNTPLKADHQRVLGPIETDTSPMSGRRGSTWAPQPLALVFIDLTNA